MKKHLWILTTAALLVSLCAQAAPTFEASSTAVGESSTITIEKPADTQTSDLLVAALMFDLGYRIDITPPTGWVQIRRTNNSRKVGMATYYRVANNTEPASYSFPLNKNVKWSAGISRISGVDLEQPVDASASKTGRRGNVLAPSVTSRKDDALILAFYTNRRSATYTPHSATAEKYDRPNTAEGKPSNMLAIFEQAQASDTGNKTATPSRSDRQWVGMQIAINGSEPDLPDLSRFSITATGNPLAGDLISLQITDAQDAAGTPLNGAVATAITSHLDGLISDREIVFTDGNASLSITLATAATHTMTIAITGVTQSKSMTLTVGRRPITLAADSGQSKAQGDPDPVLTFALIDGLLIDGIPLSGEPTRAPGEEAGLYAIRQGSLTDANNPTYAITFVSAEFEITPLAPPPARGTDTLPGIWISAAELAELPTNGAPWQSLKEDANTYWGVPNISDQEDKADIYAMSKALVYARTGIESYRTEVVTACLQAMGTEEGGRTLALSRNLVGFIIAADLVELHPDNDDNFCEWLRELLTEEMSDGYSLTTCHELRPDSWGTFAGASRAAAAAYLEDRDELDRVAEVFKGWLGDREAHDELRFGNLSWQADPAAPVGINPANSTLQGHNVDGVLPDSQRKSGEFTWPPPKENDVYEALQGALVQAVILHRKGYDVWNWENQALRRAFNWLHTVADYPAEGDDLWQPFIVNSYYDADFATPDISLPGKNVSRTCWTHSELFEDRSCGTDLDFFPGDYSDAMIIGNSLPAGWRPFASDSVWNTPIPDDAITHEDSAKIIELAEERALNGHIRFSSSYVPPIWVVNSKNALPVGTPSDPSRPMDLHWMHINSIRIFDFWDMDRDHVSDVPIPLAKGMYPEPERDGHICIIDPFKKVAYEMSSYYGWGEGEPWVNGWPANDPPECTTFNIWDLTGDGVGNPFEGWKWGVRGGRGSGFPVIAGMIRPEELLAGEIRHAMVFTFGKNRDVSGGQIMMLPPACRSDGWYDNDDPPGAIYPIEGMRFQLDPSLTEADFDDWGLTPEGKVLARALQEYGMFLGDNGGSMALTVQLLGPTKKEHLAAWEKIAPGFYESAKKIPANQFRVIYTGEPTIR